MSSEPNKPLEAALDLLVFAPVGLALTAAEEIPKLAARGRATVTGQLTMARMLGQFAVTQGRKEIERRLGGRAPASAPASTTASNPAPTSPTTTPYRDESDISYDSLLGSDPASEDGSVESGSPATVSADAAGGSVHAGAAGGRAHAGAAGGPAQAGAAGGSAHAGPRGGGHADAGVPAGGLAIPGYDSLSASQVVQRLAGLSADELQAVGAYEETHRGRRTILTRVRQLQGG